jgi:hypothetical protein
MPVSDIDKQPPTPDIINRYANVNPAEQTASGRKSDPGAELACQAHGDLAADAAAYLERSGHTLQSIGGDPQAIERQAAGLIDWARQRNLILANDYAAHLFKHNSSTAEHQVFYRESDSRAVKLTHPGTFGVTPDPKGAQRAATPLFYLHRLALMNRVFGSGLRLEGIMLGKSLIIGVAGDQPSIAVSQPWIRAADAKRPHASNSEIAEFMGSLGFVQLSRSYYGWQRREDAITILDARPDNFIKSPEGVVPIDLVISEGTPLLISALDCPSA